MSFFQNKLYYKRSAFYTCYIETIIRLRLSDYGECSPRLRIVEYNSLKEGVNVPVHGIKSSLL